MTNLGDNLHNPMSSSHSAQQLFMNNWLGSFLTIHCTSESFAPSLCCRREKPSSARAEVETTRKHGPNNCQLDMWTPIREHSISRRFVLFSLRDKTIRKWQNNVFEKHSPSLSVESDWSWSWRDRPWSPYWTKIHPFLPLLSLLVICSKLELFRKRVTEEFLLLPLYLYREKIISRA